MNLPNVTVKIEFELTSTPLTSTAGLAFIGRQLEDPKFDRHLASLCPHKRTKGRIPDGDIARTMIGLICLGKPYFDAAGEFRQDRFFADALRLQALPSPEILRQRIQALPEEAGAAFRELTTRMLARRPELLTAEYHGKRWMPVHVDVSPFDNSGSHKEGVSCTYKKTDGYAPIFAYAGPHGLLLNNELRPGSAHCNCEGTAAWLGRTLRRAEAVAPEDVRRLVVTDAGHDAAENLVLLEKAPETDFVVKHNLRGQDPAEWLAEAQRQTGSENYEKLDRGARTWYGEHIREVCFEEQSAHIRLVWRATERFARPDGQFLMTPELTIEPWWTSLEWTPQQIHQFYQQRGTSEQFHSELKGDLDLERLPSGNFRANQHILDMGMIAYNILRGMGQQMLASGLVPGRKAESERLRLRTVLQNLIYMAGRIVRHARRYILRVFEGHGWAPVAMAMARGPD